VVAIAELRSCVNVLLSLVRLGLHRFSVRLFPRPRLLAGLLHQTICSGLLIKLVRCSEQEIWQNAISSLSKVIKNRYLRASRLKRFVRTIPVEPNDYFSRANWLAWCILSHFLGIEWVEANIANYRGGDRFIGRQSKIFKSPQHLQDHRRKVISFAEMLLNLQDVSGFEKVLELAATNNLEDACAEFESGKFLYSLGIWFRFNKPKGNSTSDYDLEFKVASGQVVFGDTKNKRLTTSLTTNTILQSLNKARTQVPPDRPSFPFLRVPHAWLEEPDIAIVDSAIAEFLRNTTSVAAVLVHTSFVKRFSETFSEVGLNLKIFTNPICKFQDDKGWELPQNLPSLKWKSLFSVLGHKPPV